MTALSIPIGIDDFRELREKKLAYVDKSNLIQELLDRPGVKAALLPRPRRFGKSLNLSMLRYWFEKRDEDLSHLFRDLSIWRAGEAYRAHFQRYPVILFNLKGARGDTFDECWEAIRAKIIALYREHSYLLEGGRLDSVQARQYQQILDGTAERALFDRALLDLSDCLHRHHGEEVVILLDEYDSPIHIAHIHGYAPKVLDFMRAFLGAGLKTNPHLHRAVVTGILRVAKESLFSDVNHLGVYTLLATPFRTCFGFTEAEVAALLERAGRAGDLGAVRDWYNGYLFGGEVVYNPWSVLSFLDRGEKTPRAYWLSTSSNDLVRELLERYAFTLPPVFEALLSGQAIEEPLEESVVLSDLHLRPGALYSLLVQTGYLRAEELPPRPDDDRVFYRLSIPNREVRQIYSSTFRGWMDLRLQGHGGSLERLTTALLAGDAEGFEEQLQAFVENVLSYQDTAAARGAARERVADPEAVYHGFVVGLLAVMEPAYLVRSNRESGQGRPDVMIRPREPGKPAAVLELKVVPRGKKSPQASLREGLAQIRRNRYEAELLAAGASAVHAFAIAFDGKRVWVRLSPKAKAAKRPAPGKRSPARKSASTEKKASSKKPPRGEASRRVRGTSRS